MNFLGTSTCTLQCQTFHCVALLQTQVELKTTCKTLVKSYRVALGVTCTFVALQEDCFKAALIEVELSFEALTRLFSQKGK